MRVKAFKRTIIVILMIAACIVPALAKGNNEQVSEAMQVSSFVRRISTLFDFATSEICIAVHPFPSVLKAFTQYDTTRGSWDSGEVSYGVLVNRPLSEVKETDFLLSSEDRSTFTLEDMSSMFSRVEKNGKRVIAQRDLTAEKKSWGIIAYLFVIFTVLEVLYVTIRGYLVDEENLIRKLVTRLLMAGILFLVLMTLPALVELFRIGFFQLAETITTPFAFTEVTESRSVFELPGGVVRCTSKLLQNMSPESMGWDLYEKLGRGGLNGFPANFGDWFLKSVMKFLYFCLQISVMILSLVSAFTIMANIVEVYILLAIVMCLVPFQVFSGTKFLVGENLIKSLFANVVELFVIMVIIGTTANAAYVISQVGVAYLTNPDYYPVTMTIDTKKLAQEGSSIFSPGNESHQGLSLEFYTNIEGLEPDPDSGYTEADRTKVITAFRERFVEQYVNNSNEGDSRRSLDAYRNPGERVDAVSKVYLAGFIPAYTSSSIPAADDNTVFHFVGEESGNSDFSDSKERRSLSSPAFVVSTLLGYLAQGDHLGLLDDSPGSSEEGERQIRENLNKLFQDLGEETGDEAKFLGSSAVVDVDFDISSLYEVENFRGTTLWLAKIPIKSVRLSLLGMLGEGVEKSYDGNNKVDRFLLEFLNNCMSAAGSSMKWGTLSYLEKSQVLSVISNYAGEAITVNHDDGLIESANLTIEGLTKPSWGLMVQHFFVSIMAALMQVYFIKKSSSITQALMSGGVSQDRLAALERGIGRMAVAGGMAPLRMGVGLLGGIAGGLSNNASGPTPGAASGAAGAAGRAGGGAPINDIRP